jgi:hypothetical protein
MGIIRPKSGWFDLHLSDLWRYRDLTLLFVWRDFVAQYKQTILGPLWHLVQPLFTTVFFTLIFGHVAKLSTDSLPPVRWLSILPATSVYSFPSHRGLRPDFCGQFQKSREGSRKLHAAGRHGTVRFQLFKWLT